MPSAKNRKLEACATLKNRSANFGGVAIQGPRVIDLFHELLGQDVELPARNCIRDFVIENMPVSVARTGYTGEDGVEVFFRANDAAKFWNLVLERGKKIGAKPCGLGARGIKPLSKAPGPGTQWCAGDECVRGSTGSLRLRTSGPSPSSAETNVSNRCTNRSPGSAARLRNLARAVISV